MNWTTDPRVQLIGSLLLVTALAAVLLRRVLHRRCRHLHATAPDADQHLLAELLHCALGPGTLLLWYYGLYAALHVALTSGWLPRNWEWAPGVLRHASVLGVFISFLWFFYRAADVIDERLKRAASRTAGRVDDVLLPLLGSAVRAVVPILAIFLLLRLWPLAPESMMVLRKLLAVALVAALTWVLRRGVVLTDAAVLGPSGTLAANATLVQRALYTRVRMLRRIALVLITTVAFAAVLMMFDEVRDVGKSILASAGIAGIVLGFAAQRTLGNLFAGIQIALTQPIRLGDQVLVEGDVGNVEEITLTYVVVRVWDQRRIVLPISYFIEKPFQNWTRVATNMLSPLVLRFDFSLPVDELRTFMQREIAQSPFWDKKVFGVQVTNADSASMEVRVLASAPDSGASFNLQCELREKAIDFVRRNYPESLPKARQEQHRIASWRETAAHTDGNAPLVMPGTRERSEAPATERK